MSAPEFSSFPAMCPDTHLAVSTSVSASGWRLTSRLAHRAVWQWLPLLALPCLLGVGQCQPPCSADGDGDGVCDPDEHCQGADDALDADGDGLPDGCDVCPADPANDTDNDGVCDSAAPVRFLVSPPRDGAVLQRNDSNSNLLSISGEVLAGGYTSAVLELTRDSAPFGTLSTPLLPGPSGLPRFEFQQALPAGFYAYDLRLSLIGTGGSLEVLQRSNLAVGELVLLQGQSNAVAGDYYAEGLANLEANGWIRSFGTASLNATDVSQDLTWGMADGQGIYVHAAVGSWGLRLGKRLMDELQVPVGLLNGAVGGTTISQHARNDLATEDLNTIYGRFLSRARKGGLASSARYLFWYQGESDAIGWGSGSNAAAYLDRFDALKADWAQDFPALKHIYVFQIRNGCGVDLPTDGAVQLGFTDAAGSWLSLDTYLFEGTSSWRQVALHRALPMGGTSAVFQVVTLGAGPLIFDDTLGTLDGVGNFLPNPSFETGTRTPEGWSVVSTGTYGLVTSPVHEGAKALSVDASSGSAGAWTSVSGLPAGDVGFAAWVLPTVQDVYVDMREVLRSLPLYYPDVTLLSTNGAPGHDGCHFQVAGYQALGDQAARVLLRDFFRAPGGVELEPPQVQTITRLDATHLYLTLRDPASRLLPEPQAEAVFYLDDARVVGMRVEAGGLELTLDRPSVADELSYLPISGEGPDLLNERGEGLISFYRQPLE